MELVVRQLFSGQENEQFITHLFLKELGVKASRRTVSDALEEHPDFPSLLAIKDVLSSLGVESVAVKLDEEHFSQIDTAFISRTRPGKSGGGYFTLVRPRSKNGFEYIDPGSGKWLPLEAKDYGAILEPIALFAEAAEDAGERNYGEVHRRESRSTVFQWLKISKI